MPIRSAEQFERDATRNILHYQSAELKDVIARLRLYHSPEGAPAAVRAHLLTDLRDSVRRWQVLRKDEFAQRHGRELLEEVLRESAGVVRKFLPLVDGDILFRWAPRNLDQRGALQALISGGQVEQDETHRRDLGREVNLQVSSAVVQHVAIYANDMRIEIGAWGLAHNPVGEATSYDLVVRSSLHGMRIAELAKSARVHREVASSMASFLVPQKYRERARRFQTYPLWDFIPIMNLAHPGGAFLGGNRVLLAQDDAAHHRYGRANQLQQRVICSHFVNAVLYASIRPGGTLATATDHAYDEVFKVSPAQMWLEFMTKGGMWAETDAVFVGLQHRGRLDPGFVDDPRRLGVGLKPPVPSRVGRPPVPLHN
jgi:hypothetical protein